MAHILYVSRTDSAHDARWKSALASAGHDVSTAKAVDLLNSTAIGTSRADLVVAGPLTDCASAALASGIAPVLGLCWGFDVLVEANTPVVKRRLAKVLPKLVGTHVDCQDLRARVIGLGADPDSVSVSAWGIDVDFFRPGLPVSPVKAQVGWGPEHKVVYTSRAWHPLYDVEVVLRAFAQASREDPALRLAWAGDGPMGPSLSRLAADLALGDRVARLGRLSPAQVRDWLRSSDLYVSASTSDGSSVSLMEALGVGIPVAVTALASNGEWVTGDEVGALFPVGDYRTLANMITGMTQGPISVSDMQSRREVVLQKGVWATNAQIFSDAVSRALS